MSGKSIFTSTAFTALAVALSVAALPASAQAQPPGGVERSQGRWQEQRGGGSARSEQRAQPQARTEAQIRPQAQAQSRPSWSQSQPTARPDRSSGAPSWQGRNGGQQQAVGQPAPSPQDRAQQYRTQQDRGDQSQRDRAGATPQRGWDGNRWNQTSPRTQERNTVNRDRVPSWSNDARRDNNNWRNDDNRRESWQQRDSWQRDNARRDDNRRWGNDNRRSSYRGDYRQWSNDWRRDQRYNWSGYRDSNRYHYRMPRYAAPYRGYNYSRFSIGIFLNSGFYGRNYWINDPWSYRLPAAYGPYRWVRYYDDVMLVDVYSGEVVDVIYDFFW
ncbi:RcnB family protein [Novosphingobium sp. SL115]|uniref:RcnB family protein n=1 Tax=Novosphingobium sp. SL115 TaxID=2995150 RepID=UPI0022735E19|nr:RcnB family protein [Novosphingobium sp. SL115]MCY1671420.1 RcnB family protein [Novosphingobium sp. SL115]